MHFTWEKVEHSSLMCLSHLLNTSCLAIPLKDIWTNGEQLITSLTFDNFM